MRLHLQSAVALVVLAAVSACAGKSTTDGGTQLPNGGSSHEGGAGGVAGATANGGSDATAGAAPVSIYCPDLRPANGSACNYVGNQCNYEVDMCSSIGLICTNGLWAEQPRNDGASLTCWNFRADQRGIPKNGDSCSCLGVLDCTFNECDAQGSVHAVCDNTTWHVTSEQCTDAPCGPDGLRCKTGEACVVFPGGIGESFECKADPCATESQTPSCDCASSLCGAERCVMSDSQVECLCDSC